jgi:hypothetical protein
MPALSLLELRFSKARRTVNIKNLALIRKLPCSVCGSKPPNDPHHLISVGAGGGDDMAIPLCRRHHTEIHACGVHYMVEKYQRFSTILSSFGFETRNELGVMKLRRK